MVTAQTYNRYKKRVLEMSPAIQYFDGKTIVRHASCLSDREIGERLGLDAEDVTEIRCMAEIDLLPADTWAKSAEWKKKRARKAREK